MSKSDVQRWFKLSRIDLLMAEHLLSSRNPEMWIGVVFNSQQSVEKSIKGILTFKTVRFTKTHDIAKLSSDLLTFYPELNDLLRKASDLTPYAVAYRYQDALIEELTEPQVLESRALAKNVYAELTTRMNTNEIR